MVYAPVIIPTLCRYEHFVRCLESLAKNSLAQETEVFVGLDFPLNESHIEGHEKIKQYLSENSLKFKCLHVLQRPCNYGIRENARALRTVVFEKYDCFIFAEDDIEFSRDFLTYMNEGLMLAKNDSEILAVSGYSYPVNWVVSKGATALKIQSWCPAWGIGFWRETYLNVSAQLEQGYLFEYKDKVFDRETTNEMLNAKLCSAATGILAVEKAELLMWGSDIANSIYMCTTHQKVIIPVQTKTRNHGFDGSGNSCGDVKQVRGKIGTDNYLYHLQELSAQTNFKFVMDTLDSKKNKDILDDFYFRSKWVIFGAKARVFLYKMFGMKGLVKFLLLGRAGRRVLKWVINKFYKT